MSSCNARACLFKVVNLTLNKFEFIHSEREGIGWNRILQPTSLQVLNTIENKCLPATFQEKGCEPRKK